MSDDYVVVLLIAGAAAAGAASRAAPYAPRQRGDENRSTATAGCVLELIMRLTLLLPAPSSYYWHSDHGAALVDGCG